MGDDKRSRPEMVHVYRSKRRHEYYVQPMCVSQPWGHNSEYGDYITVPAEELHSRIAETVLGALARFHTTVWDQRVALSAAEKSKFMDRLDTVTVTAYDTGVVEVTPFVRVRGGHSGLKETVCLRREDAQKGLPGAILEAFRRIGS